MLNENDASSQSGQEVDFSMVEQVVVLALKSCMWFLLNFKLNITRKHPRHLITFAWEIDLVA